MTRAELEKQYRTVKGRIVTRGKFEAEMIYVPYLWTLAMEGRRASSEEWRGDGLFLTLDIEPEDVRQFPELEGFRSVEMYEDDAGFVTCTVRP